MVFQYKLQKVLSIKENEKDKVLGEYNDAVKKFELVATKLYEFLKHKEEMEEFQQLKIKSGLNIQQIQQLHRSIHFIEQSISQQQQLVILARQEMELKEKVLVEKNIEVKKYEKLKKNAIQTFREQQQLEEGKLMDEISIQQFMNRGSKVFS
ncbi:flagellar export protein FliJ [Bacillus sp. Marseille-P3661]|uniref:flagellar export protein FliJ n=1 Tax=Bacillus sp. Marseille-P3661 TaxID=1936234 RepID=UPI000C840FBC|nr:flagellar export protein FliJ [Bacillus sp. Marseille-P3661]